MNWISIKDRLPDNFKDVLFFLITDKVNPEYVIGHYNNGNWYSCRFHESTELVNDPDILNITHWMLLPESPIEN